MRDLRVLRQGWEERQRAAAGVSCQMTLQESVEIWLRLQQAFEPHLKDTAALFAADRRQTLFELQARLRRLAEWQERHGEPFPLGSDAADPVVRS